jgi:N-acetylglucosamine kinase
MILAFDIGGSRIRAAVWNGGRLHPLGEIATPAADPRAFAEAIRGFAVRNVRGIAISIAGVVDPASGVGKVANIPAIDGLALGPELERVTGLPVLVRNDADCLALAEATQGAGRGCPSVFGVILGTGVGGGLVIGGEFAFPCGCGQTGCVDTIGGARGLERLHRARTGEAAGAEAIVGAWSAGEAAAGATMALWRDLVSGPLAMVVNVVGADCVPVGGGLSRAAGLVRYLDEAVRVRILRRTTAPLLVPAECGPDAGLLGAALAGRAAWG